MHESQSFSDEKLKKKLGRGTASPSGLGIIPSGIGVWEGGVKRSNRYNFRLVHSGKNHPECTKTHQFPLRTQKISSGEGHSLPTPQPIDCM